MPDQPQFPLGVQADVPLAEVGLQTAVSKPSVKLKGKALPARLNTGMLMWMFRLALSTLSPLLPLKLPNGGKPVAGCAEAVSEAANINVTNNASVRASMISPSC